MSIDSVSQTPQLFCRGVGADRCCVHALQWVGVQGINVAPPAFQISPTLPAVSEGGLCTNRNRISVGDMKGEPGAEGGSLELALQ